MLNSISFVRFTVVFRIAVGHLDHDSYATEASKYHQTGRVSSPLCERDGLSPVCWTIDTSLSLKSFEG